MIKFRFVATFFVATFLTAGEISVFDAGDTSSSEPYGLTANEEVILQNKRKIDSLTSKVEMQQEAIDGLRSVIESQNETILALKGKIADIELILKSKQFSKKTTKLDFSTKKPSVILKESMELFNQRKYSDAKKGYLELIKRGQERDKAYFMLGQIDFVNRAYSNALANYKESAALNDKAYHMPALLLNSAKSLEALNDKKNADKFYSILKKRFPESNEAKSIKNR